ncbi:hypothetical protein J6P92_00750 [bacterium]|nr:hypothetical protein [bacterium]
MMSQAYMLSVKDNGYANEWNVGNGLNSTTANQIANYIKPYLRIIKDCNINSGCLNYKTNLKCLNGSSASHNYDTEHIYYKIITADGSYIWWRGADSYCITTEGNVSNVCSAIFYDINGNKEPNTVGKDIFLVYITPLGLKTRDNCAYNNNGWGCLGFILKNNNMNYPLNE